MSVKNQGLWLEKEIRLILDTYVARGFLDMSKVDPPTRVIHGPHPKVIMLANPFLDYVGVWMEVGRQGRAVFLEAKSTAEPRLGILQSGGLSERQVDSLRRWARAGAAVGVLWAHKQQMRFVPLVAIEAQLERDTKHVKWEHARVIKPGMGWCTWDFLEALRAYYPVAQWQP